MALGESSIDRFEKLCRGAPYQWVTGDKTHFVFAQRCLVQEDIGSYFSLV